jgi:hypothetical protein
MQTRVDCRFPDVTRLTPTYRVAILLTAICGPAPGELQRQTQLSKEASHCLAARGGGRK